MKYLKQSNVFQFEEDTFNKNAQKIAQIMHEALFLVKFHQPKAQIENEKKSFFMTCNILRFQVHQLKEKIDVSYCSFQAFHPRKRRCKLEIVTCDICNIDVHTPSYIKHLGSNNNKENEKEVPTIFSFETDTSNTSKDII